MGTHWTVLSYECKFEGRVSREGLTRERASENHSPLETKLQVHAEDFGASGEIRTLKHLFLRQAAIPIRARWHMVHRGGFEPPRPTRGDRVTAGPFRPGSRTCANLAEGRRIERPSLITTLWFSGPVAGHSAVPSAIAESAVVEPASLLREPEFRKDD